MGENYKILGTACDYKRLNDNDLGPNTGGMGCYSPTYWLNATDEQLIKRFQKDKLDFSGITNDNIFERLESKGIGKFSKIS